MILIDIRSFQWSNPFSGFSSALEQNPKPCPGPQCPTHLLPSSSLAASSALSPVILLQSQLPWCFLDTPNLPLLSAYFLLCSQLPGSCLHSGISPSNRPSLVVSLSKVISGFYPHVLVFLLAPFSARIILHVFCYICI